MVLSKRQNQEPGVVATFPRPEERGTGLYRAVACAAITAKRNWTFQSVVIGEGDVLQIDSGGTVKAIESPNKPDIRFKSGKPKV